MSAVIRHFVVHQFVLNPQQELVIIPKQECFDVTPAIEELAHQINHAFNAKPGKGVGGFIDPQSHQPDEDDEGGVSSQRIGEFRAILNVMLQSEDGFVDFSLQSAELLKRSLLETGTVETGFIVFSHYEFLATEYLMISLLNTREHIEITKELELNTSDHLDLAKMQLAVRIDLTQLKTSPEQNRYISFIKGRMGRKVSDFFMGFIGCQELVDVKQQNKQLISAVDEYLAAEQLAPQEKLETRQVVADYYKEKLEQGEDIEIKELATKLPAESEEGFYTFKPIV